MVKKVILELVMAIFDINGESMQENEEIYANTERNRNTEIENSVLLAR